MSKIDTSGMSCDEITDLIYDIRDGRVNPNDVIWHFYEPVEVKNKEDDMKKKEYYALDDILNWMDIDYEFEKRKSYPFNRGRENVKFGWGTNSYTQIWNLSNCSE